jgi:hypothetical protein
MRASEITESASAGATASGGIAPVSSAHGHAVKIWRFFIVR